MVSAMGVEREGISASELTVIIEKSSIDAVADVKRAGADSTQLTEVGAAAEEGA